MASGGEIVGAAGGAAAIIPGLIGRGKSDYNAQDISHSGMYDPFAYQFGQYGAENYAQGREQQARAIDQRTAPQANYMQADMDRQRALQARASQATVMNQLMARAAGQTPSIAQMQGDRQMQQAAGQQAALQASARGRGALGNAATTAASNTANAAQGISNSTQINAANERLQAEQAAFGAASGMRGQDYQSQGQAANQAQFQAGMQLGSRQTNDARATNLQQMGHQAQQQEQQGRVQMQGIAAGSHANAQNQNATTERQNAGSKGLIDTIGDFLSDVSVKEPYVTSDFSAKQPFALVAGGGMNPMSGAAPASFDKLTAGGGGMDPMASLQAHSDFATQYASNPTGGMTGGAMMVSDERAKRAAFEQGAAYADAEHAGKPIAPPAYAVQKPDEKRKPQIGAKIGDATSRLTGEDAQKLRDVAVAASMGPTAATAPMVALDKAGDLAAQEIHRGADAKTIPQATGAVRNVGSVLLGPVAGPAYRHVTSDFRAKEGLTRDAFGNAAQGDPNAPQFRFVPGQGWVNGAAPQHYSLEEMRDSGNEPDFGDVADQDARIAALGAKGEQQVQDSADSEPMDSKGEKRQAPGTADFQRTEPKPQEGDGPKPWWMGIGAAAKGLNDAQFGAPVRSDRRAKEVIDLDAVDIDNDPGAQDFDADEYLESKAPKPYEREGQTTRHNTKAEMARVKRATEDRAGRDADDMMAGMRANLGRGSAVASKLAPEQTPVAEANRTMVGSMYRYKPEHTPPEQKPGEPNFGFMAQNLEKSPITATAVKEDPSGLKRVDALKLLRILGASVADLQQQQDETRLALSKGGRR
jgi:hypothetical protein